MDKAGVIDYYKYMNFPDLSAFKEAVGPFGFLLNSGFWFGVYFYVRQLAIVLGFAFLIFSAIVFVRIWPYRMRFYVLEGRRAYKLPQSKRVAEDEERISRRRKWDSIIKKTEAAGPQGYAISIIEADILLEDTMGRLGFLGKNLVERLRSSAPGELPSINDIWEAHKLRNRIAHEPNFRPSREETTRALGAYKKALEELAAI